MIINCSSVRQLFPSFLYYSLFPPLVLGFDGWIAVVDKVASHCTVFAP